MRPEENATTRSQNHGTYSTSMSRVSTKVIPIQTETIGFKCALLLAYRIKESRYQSYRLKESRYQ